MNRILANIFSQINAIAAFGIIIVFFAGGVVLDHSWLKWNYTDTTNRASLIDIIFVVGFTFIGVLIAGMICGFAATIIEPDPKRVE